MRTHCEGPAEPDIFGSEGLMAAGTVDTRRLLSPTQTVVLLPESGGFAAPGYGGRRGGAIRLSMSLASVQAGTTKGRLP